MGEDPTKGFANIMPYIGQVAIGKKSSLKIFGTDYETPDGTGKNIKKCIPLDKNISIFYFRCSRLHPRNGFGFRTRCCFGQIEKGS